MGITVSYTPSSGQFDNTAVVTDGLGSFTNETDANGAETKPLVSDVVEFTASGDDKQPSITCSGSGFPPGVSGVDEGSGVFHCEGTPTDGIIPTYPIAIYDKENPLTVSTGGTPATYTLGDQVNVYKSYDVEVTGTHLASASVTVPMFIIKDWGVELQNMLDYIASTYPE